MSPNLAIERGPHIVSYTYTLIWRSVVLAPAHYEWHFWVLAHTRGRNPVPVVAGTVLEIPGSEHSSFRGFYIVKSQQMRTTVPRNLDFNLICWPWSYLIQGRQDLNLLRTKLDIFQFEALLLQRHHWHHGDSDQAFGHRIPSRDVGPVIPRCSEPHQPNWVQHFGRGTQVIGFKAQLSNQLYSYTSSLYPRYIQLVA